MKRFEFEFERRRTGSMLATRHERFSAFGPIILLRAYGQRFEAFGVDFAGLMVGLVKWHIFGLRTLEKCAQALYLVL